MPSSFGGKGSGPVFKQEDPVVIDLVGEDEGVKAEGGNPQLPEIHDWRIGRHWGSNLRGKDGQRRGNHCQRRERSRSRSEETRASSDIDSEWGELNLAPVEPGEFDDLRRFPCPVRRTCIRVFDTSRERDEHVGLFHRDSQEAFELRSRAFAKEVDQAGTPLTVGGVRCPRPLLRYHCPGFSNGGKVPRSRLHPALEQAISDEITHNRPGRWDLATVCGAFITAMRVEQKIKGVPLRGMEILIEAVYKAGAQRCPRAEGLDKVRRTLKGLYRRSPLFLHVDQVEGRAMALLLYRFSKRLER
ncbi:hypothetical protein FOL47_000940 [Perkinsus chesapeaki]|uniref:Uncharacterized protein n=1 Tax=Perkinsus chesapeaki TaxID=330153 RepID=A0A7J6N0Y7_PERCH|nr:hypothetical protein FOL47_000940 [Perkinsus chesapeaki]